MAARSSFLRCCCDFHFTSKQGESPWITWWIAQALMLSPALFLLPPPPPAVGAWWTTTGKPQGA